MRRWPWKGKGNPLDHRTRLARHGIDRAEMVVVEASDRSTPRAGTISRDSCNPLAGKAVVAVRIRRIDRMPAGGARTRFSLDTPGETI